MTALACKAAGAVLLTLTGLGGGLAFCRTQASRWQSLCALTRFLSALLDAVRFGALPCDEWLAQAAQDPDFSAFCPNGCTRFDDLRLPHALDAACTAELRAGLSALGGCGREQALHTLTGLLAICRRCADEQYRRVRQSSALAPQLGVCCGLLAAIVLCTAG